MARPPRVSIRAQRGNSFLETAGPLLDVRCRCRLEAQVPPDPVDDDELDGWEGGEEDDGGWGDDVDLTGWEEDDEPIEKPSKRG